MTKEGEKGEYLTTTTTTNAKKMAILKVPNDCKLQSYRAFE